MKNSGKLKDYYRIENFLGKSEFGEVRKVQSKESGVQRAVKVMRKDKMSPSDRQALANEINILKSLDHPNIIRLYEIFEDEKRFYLLTDFVQGGELFDKLLHDKFLKEQDAAILAR